MEDLMFAIQNEFVTNPSRLPAALTSEEAVAAGPETCGGKGYNLGRLHRYGFRIPRGGVIPAAWYPEILASVPPETMDKVRGITAENVTDPSVTSALELIQTSLETAEIPAALLSGITDRKSVV